MTLRSFWNEPFKKNTKYCQEHFLTKEGLL